jgi:cell wall assembly regulator SMI1
MRDMADLWRRLEAQAAKTPLGLRMNPPATERAIRAAERTIGLEFPVDFRASLRVHDGQEPGDGSGEDVFPWLPAQAGLASLDRIVEEWKREKETFIEHHANEPPEEIAGGELFHYLWHPKRIPIAGNPWFDQDNTYIDFIPGPKGVAGQLAIFGKGCFGDVQAPSFGAALELYVNALESGEWFFERGEVFARNKRLARWSKYVKTKLAKAR